MRTLILVLLSFVVPQIALAAQPGGSCLGEKRERKVARARSVEERLRVLAEIARKQGDELWGHVGRYRRWTQTGRGWVPPPTTEQILDLHDCAVRAMLEQLDSWSVRAPDWRKQLEAAAEDVEESCESVKLAKCLAEMRSPELVPRIQASVELLEEVRDRIGEFLAAPSPYAPRARSCPALSPVGGTKLFDNRTALRATPEVPLAERGGSSGVVHR